ncbi:MAG: heme o synthase [Buchnera aphidicola (Meitanaphis microgallis)]
MVLFLELLKPKIIFGNLISCLGGFLLASKGNIHYNLLFLNLIGISLIVGSSCILNNVIDYKLDKQMSRTKNRILVTNVCYYNLAIYFAIFLGILGLFTYGYFINILCMFFALLGFIIYVIFYSLYLKKRSIYSTVIGSISGAIPPVLGYCSVTNYIDLCAINLFIVLIFWQIPHSYAIFLMHLNDYKHANIPIFPIVKSFLVTQYHIKICILLFLIFSCFFTVMHFTGYKFFFSILVLSIVWLYLSSKTYDDDKNHIIWSKNIFYHSIIIMLVMNIMMAIDCVS